MTSIILDERDRRTMAHKRIEPRLAFLDCLQHGGMLDGECRNRAHPLHQPEVGLSCNPRLPIIGSQRAEHPTGRTFYRLRPAGPQAMSQGNMRTARPERMNRDVFRDDGSSVIGGSATGAGSRTDRNVRKQAGILLRQTGACTE